MAISYARTLAEDIVTALQSLEALELSPVLIDASSAPQTILDRVYSVDIQNANTGIDRDQDRYRGRFAVEIRQLFRINPHQQWAAYLEALDMDEAIQATLLTRSKIKYATTWYRRTTRRLIMPAREYLYQATAFDIDGDVQWFTDLDYSD